MIWAYYDESGVYADRKLVNMTVAGWVAPAATWDALAVAWSRALAAEGLAAFHMKEFEAWRPPFDFTIDGRRDQDRHNRLLNVLLGIMLDHIELFAGFGAANKISDDASRAHSLAMEDCVYGAVTHAVHDLWDRYGQPIHLVFAKQDHFKQPKIGRYVELYNWGAGQGRIPSMTMADANSLPQLQAADILAYEMARRQRDRDERYPFRMLQQGCKERGLALTLKWGPFSRQSTG